MSQNPSLKFPWVSQVVMEPSKFRENHLQTYPEVAVVEPTGAGDVHAAAMMIGLLSGWELERTGRFANAAGALAVTAMGHLGEALPTPESILSMLDG